MKTIQITVDRSRWMASVEYAYLKVTSPTGKHVFIHKCNLLRLTIAEGELTRRLADDKRPEIMAVTFEEMRMIKTISDKTK